MPSAMAEYPSVPSILSAPELKRLALSVNGTITSGVWENVFLEISQFPGYFIFLLIILLF
jgi:hypothetical protein